ncbi:probable multidrug resistance-associated protein lethal(2)03659 [Zophobas morio]|uniref:probable multidrug resistance-associated protein lethal(2)03659 n=1 Tax=Zophobas morio TaxID=2755281 RepID=UPI0030827F7F
MVILDEMDINPDWIDISKVEQRLVALFYRSMQQLLPMLSGSNWQLPILLKSRTFTENNLYEAAKEHKATALGDKLEFFWKEEENYKNHPSLTRALLKTFGKEYLLKGIILLPIDLGVMLADSKVNDPQHLQELRYLLASYSYSVLVVFKQMFLRKIEVALKSDCRIRLINDVIGGIQTVKMYTWEIPFSKLVKAARRSEMKALIKSNLLTINNNTIRMYVTKIALFLCVMGAILTKVSLTPEYIFPLISLYENLILVGMLRFQWALAYCREAKISVARIQEFLLSGHKKTSLRKPSKSTDTCSPKSYQSSERSAFGILLNNVNVTFDTFTVLESVTFSVLPGDLVGLSGKSGSGKSTLLQVILQEIKAKGSIAVGGKISYASQEAWIFSASIKQNILFGEEEDEKKYRRLIRACALERDFSLFANGDQTLVGERGVMLSGGQKSRINLARAVYRDADIYLLDDPLAAVDASVAQQIFNECVLGYLKEKCVVLVTHHLKYLRNVKKRYIINKGKVVEEASSENVFMESDVVTMQEDVIKSHNLPSEIHESATTNYSTRQICKNFIDMFIVLPIISNKTKSFHFFRLTLEHFLYVYASLIVLLFFLNHTLSVIFMKHCMSISKTLHNTLLDKILTVPMKFFNEHPSDQPSTHLE